MHLNLKSGPSVRHGSTREVVIVGAGPGGLSASILLAAAGVRVRILERLPIVGGRTSTIESQGFKFDLGPTFFLYPRILDEILRTAGTSLQAEVEMIRLDPQYRLTFGAGGQIDCTPERAEMERQIAALAPNDVPGFGRFLEDNRRKLALMQPCLESSFSSWKDIFAPSLLKLLPMLRPHQSIDTYLRCFFADERIRLAFSFQSKYLGMSPFRCPSLFSILSFLEYEYGVFHPIGGCGAVMTALARVARRMGVEIHLDEPVEEVLLEGRRATGARTREGVYAADAVVLNADFARAMSRLLPNGKLRRWNARKMAKKKFSCSTFMLYLGIEGRYDLPHHNIHISADYARNLDEIENRHVLSEDPSFYIQNASVTDPTLAPAGMSSIYFLVPVTHQHPNVDWSRERERYRALALQKAAQAGFTDLERRIRFERLLTPDDWEKQYEIHRGATFNLAHSLGQLLHLRPHNRFEDVDGVYLVGGGTHPGSGLPVIFESARISSRLLLQDLGVSAPEIPAAFPLEEAAA